ncbi:MAG: Na(+)-translocating NADH-quinone reductase subunit A [Bacteroidales bacterium]|nr:Na(+)-translocating NADH-quinone reductase subunit A [Bacteroidales bacterium]MBQ6957466.1 Na(+)-translocating NADH-quinone reductase subunit A [Bacteroidales bacterium]
MSDQIRLKKGLDLPIAGAALCEVTLQVSPDLVAVKPTDFRGMVPRLLVKEGDSVKAGTPLFSDKKCPEMVFCSPVSGTVDAVVRGDKRKLLAVRVKADGKKEAVQFDVPKISSLDKQGVTELLLKSGLWPCLKQRPFGTVADPKAEPKAIFISAMNTAPLGADWDFTLKNDLAAIQAGIDALGRLTKGGVHLSLAAKNYAGSEFHKLSGVIFHQFEGPHPAGNVGVQINHISPINKGEVVWTVSLPLVAVIGRFFLKGVYDASRTIAVAGPAAINPSYAEVPAGVCMADLAAHFPKGDVRIVSGDVLSGEAVGADGFLGFYDDQVSVLKEGNYYEMFGWINPLRSKKFSVSHAYPAFLRRKKYDMDTNENGGERPFLMNDVYDKVLPMDIYPLYLFKACLAGDLDKMEQLGIYEVIEEDVALCEYVCPSKIEIQKIIREGIELMMKEM